MKIETLHEIFLKSSGVCTDTRKITENCLFFALRGDNFNGNNFVQEALEKGACKAVIDDLATHRNTGETILHGNALSMLQKLATYHRNNLGIPIVALTGSNGKTTTKELIHAVLAKKFRTTATTGNLNNHIGVPLTLLSMDKNTEIGVVEMGANHLREIEQLCTIAMPNLGYITNFGKAHLEGFGSEEGVVKGKSELYKHLAKNDGFVFVNGNDAKQLELTKKMNRLVFGSGDFECSVKLLDAGDHLKLEFDGRTIHSNLIGVYNFHNIAAAIAIGSYFKVPSEMIKEAIESYVPKNNRSQLVNRNGIDLIMDAYNANPSSMMAALENFQQIKAGNKVVILGDMFELGAAAATEHQQITDFLEANPFSRAYLIGSNFFGTKATSENIHRYKTFDDFAQSWPIEDIEGAQILVKGSRGMALERVLDLLD